VEGSSARTVFDDIQKAPNFEEYNARKYNVRLFHPDFPLVICKNVGKQLNFLTDKVDGKVRRKEMQRSVLKTVPELVNLHPFSGSLYVQGRLLPSILHRMCRLLVANEMRQDVAKYFNWDVESPNTNATTVPCSKFSKVNI